MKKLLSLIIIGMLAASPVAYANHEEGHVGPTTKEVCKTVKGKKQCKTIKVHKKFEGKKVPPKKAVVKPTPKKVVKKHK
jgi:hypothetical protein